MPPAAAITTLGENFAAAKAAIPVRVDAILTLTLVFFIILSCIFCSLSELTY
jgi:hypothetical protein